LAQLVVILAHLDLLVQEEQLQQSLVELDKYLTLQRLLVSLHHRHAHLEISSIKVFV
jgi:hypothetical protein